MGYFLPSGHVNFHERFCNNGVKIIRYDQMVDSWSSELVWWLIHHLSIPVNVHR